MQAVNRLSGMVHLECVCIEGDNSLPVPIFGERLAETKLKLKPQIAVEQAIS